MKYQVYKKERRLATDSSEKKFPHYLLAIVNHRDIADAFVDHLYSNDKDGYFDYEISVVYEDSDLFEIYKKTLPEEEQKKTDNILKTLQGILC